MGGENENTDLGVAEHRELFGLLEEPRSALAEGDLPVDRVLNPPHLNLPTSHNNITIINWLQITKA